MGYGRHLAMALRRVHAMDRQDGTDPDGQPRAIGSHPSPVLRTARIEARLRHRPGLRRLIEASAGQQLADSRRRAPDDGAVALDDDRVAACSALRSSSRSMTASGSV